MSQPMTKPAQAETAPLTDALYCSFCLKPAAEVRKLVAGQGRVFICDGCVDVCTDYITRGVSDRSSPIRIEDTPTERLLEVLAPIKETVEGKSNQLRTAVDTLRGRGISWAKIAGAFGMSRQAACERFSRLATR